MRALRTYLYPFATRLLLGCAFLLVVFSAEAQTFFGYGSTPNDNAASAGPTITINPPANMQAGDLVVIHAQYRANSFNPAIGNAGGQSWVAEASYSANTQSTRIIWCRYNGTWSANPTVTVGAGNTLALTAVMYVFRPTNANHIWAVDALQTNTSSNANPNIITGVTTTLPNSVTMGFWSGANSSTWGSLSGTGWSKTGLANQIRNTTGTQTHTAAYRILAAAGATGNVQQAPGTATTFSRSIMTWYEISNDNCSGAINLTPGNSCTNVRGTVASATNSGIAATCGGTANDDVWYRFTAQAADQVITLSSLGTNLNAAGVRMELFSGTCGSLTSLQCGTTTIGAHDLTVGQEYFIRVYSNAAGSITSLGGFSICITNILVDIGKSFINLSKPGGGSIETGDQLEIRTSVVVRRGTIDSVGFYDNIPTGTTYIPNTLRIQTNEGKVYKSFTDAAGDDQAEIVGGALSFRIGYTGASQATAFRRGQLTNTMRPSFFNSACIMLVTYRVTVTATTFTSINIGGGSVTYSTALPTVINKVLPNRILAIYPNYGICSNATGVNTIGTEFNGTFGSGNLKNRVASANVPAGYQYLHFAANAPNDYAYGVSNNTSGVYTTNSSLPKPNASRVFTVWDIIGDHTGAPNPLMGNPPADTTGGNTGGYMLVVNAAYRIDSAFDQTITGLCPNTYYEISAWFRNICSRCGCDSAGRGASTAGYIPTAPGDSSGVNPNVSIGIDGVTYYSSGNLPYTGQWVKRGFIFVTGPTQTSFTMRVYNNAPGGGGNDWAIDDITVATCLPELEFYPTIANQLCRNSSVNVQSIVSTFYDNYKYYVWERSTDGGTSWHNAPLKPGVDSFSFVHNGTNYLDTVYYPTFLATPFVNGHQYRLKVATTIANLSNDNCNTYSADEIVTVSLGMCDLLPAELGDFRGTLVEQRARLSWETLSEQGNAWFEVERSNDGQHFYPIGKVASKNPNSTTPQQYTFNDPIALSGKAWYRLKLTAENSTSSYSKTILLQANSGNGNFEIRSVVNPVTTQVQLELFAPRTETVRLQMVDLFGRTIREQKVAVEPGLNQVVLPQLQQLASGTYLLLLHTPGGLLQQRIQKF
ncbi:MAG TPA: hypothetical protein PKE07_11310 [Lacibacter sp.]|nr:hypothetical protein [Lacibacter sp.]HMO88787.1 hypothetical protein [Lacibacter sp.]